MPRPTGQLDRALAELTIGLEFGKAHRGRTNEEVGTGEIEQQVMVPLYGKAGTEWGHVDSGVGFEMPFIWAPLQRGAPYRTPHFSYGAENISGDGLVLIHVAVIKWNIDASSRVRGARMRYAACSPTAEGDPVQFFAQAHLRFQGWAGDVEEGEERAGT